VTLTVALTSFAVVFPAELPDKTALAGLMLGSRYRPLNVFVGVAAAFAVHVVLALRVVPVRLVTLIGAAVMAVLAVVSLVSAITG